MVMVPNKDDYPKYSKREKQVYWGFVIAAVVFGTLLLCWKPYIAPLLP